LALGWESQPTDRVQASDFSVESGPSSPAFEFRSKNAEPAADQRLTPTTPVSPALRFVPPKPDELQKLFPHLEILELLGQGGMGAVYKARQTKLDRVVALKILPPEVGQDPAFAQRFEREARALGRLSHPAIVAIHDFGQAGGLYYLVMEFVDGSNLRQLIESGKLAPQEALAIVPQICEALQYAHDEGVVHRDIKPENILLDKKGRVKIGDFGLAKMLDRPPGSFTLTDTHQVMGTPHYMAPEQIQGSRTVDHRADIYSLGVVIYEMLTGELPLGRFEPPSRKVQVDVRLDEVVLRALERSPERGYQHASEIKTEVEAISSLGRQGQARPQPPAISPADEEELRAEARFLIRGPAIGMIVTGVLALLQSLTLATWLVPPLIRTGPPWWHSIDEQPLLLVACASLPYGLIMLIAGWQMLHLRTYTLGVLAGVMAYVMPLGILPLVAWPVAIWTHVILWKQSVQDAFAIELRRRIRASRQSDAAKAAQAPFPWGGVATGLALLLPALALIGFAIVWTQSAWTLAALTVPWFVMGCCGVAYSDTPNERAVNAAALVLFLISLIFIGYCVWIENTAWPLTAVVACAVAAFAGAGIGTAIKDTSEEEEDEEEEAEEKEEEEEEEEDNAEEEETPAASLQTPGMWMVICGGIGCWWLLRDGWGLAQAALHGEKIANRWDLLPLVAAPVVLVGGVMMRSVRWYWLVLLAAILCLPLGLPSDSAVMIVPFGIGVWSLVLLSRPEVRDAFREQAGPWEAAEAVAKAPPKPAPGTLGRAWDDWWRQRDRWFAGSVQAVLAIVFLVCLFMYFSFHLRSEAVPGNANLRHTLTELGAPGPWFRLETYPEPTVPFRWHINYLSSSMLVMLAGFGAWYAYWQIERAKREVRHLWLGSIYTIVAIWVTLSLLAAALPVYLHLTRH
jgi:serine/threonine protein kinase